MNSSIYPIRQTADQAVASSIALANSNSMAYPLDVNTVYLFKLVAMFNLAGVVSGYRFGLTGPASPTNVIYVAEVRNLVATALVLAGTVSAFGAMLTGALAVAGNHLLVAEGTIENGANAGNLTFQFAQNTSDVGAITLKRGSLLTLIPIN
jgi:hypothetical protein